MFDTTTYRLMCKIAAAGAKAPKPKAAAAVRAVGPIEQWASGLKKGGLLHDWLLKSRKPLFGPKTSIPVNNASRLDAAATLSLLLGGLGVAGYGAYKGTDALMGMGSDEKDKQ